MNNIDRPDKIHIIEQTFPDGSIAFVVPASMLREFKLMVKKGTDLAPNKHVEITDFADRLLGRQEYVGACMKQELYGYPRYLEKQQAVIVTASPEEIKNQSQIAILRGCNWECYWPNGCSDSSRCREFGSCVAKAQANQGS